MEKTQTLIFHRLWSWLRENLFNSWLNTFLTLVSLWIIWSLASGLFSWGFFHAVFFGTDPESCRTTEGACWPVINDTLGLFMVGTYPFEDRVRPFLALLILLSAPLSAWVPRWRSLRQVQFYWFLAPFTAFLIVRGGEGWPLLPSVETDLWGGLLLTLMLTIGGIIGAFPLGLTLALGRRSSMPIIRALSIIYIEVIRGVPLVTILFMASVMLPLFLPQGVNFDKLIRAQIGIILFTAAYLAETVRGGLQALPRGQEEAAKAVGLSYWQTMGLIILPQALRIVIPTLVGQFIALLKDTSLVVIIGLYDLLGVTSLVTANPKWLGKISETYIFVGLIYWILCFSMSQIARKLELRFNQSGKK